MVFTTDHYFHIGRAHLTGGKPCQDYALSGVHEGAAYAIVCDGCSSGGHTDVGARVLTLSTAKAIREHWSVTQVLTDAVPMEIGVRQQLVMAGARESLGLAGNDMLATCLFAYVSPKGGFVHLKGDGVIAYVLQGGTIRMFRYEWENNTPLYPAYANDNYAGFVKAQGGDVNAVKLTKEVWEFVPGNVSVQLTGEEITLGDGIRGVTVPLPIQELDYVAVFSDGVTQIEGLDWKNAVVQCLAFKTTKGEYAKRRMIRVVKDAQRTGRGPIDDLAYAVIKVEHPQGGET